MRKITIIVAVALTALAVSVLALDIVLPTYSATLHAMANPLIAILAVLALIFILLDRSRRTPAQAAAPTPAPTPPPVETAAIENRHEAEVVTFLAVLQEKGRLVDFLMDDITGYTDAQVGTAARVVHEGCKAALSEHFGIKPVREEGEGATVVVPTGYAPDDYRLVGKITGQAPFTGSLVHHGWRAEWVKLPRMIRTSPDRLPTIAPAEVELS